MTSQQEFTRETRATDVVKLFETSLKGRTILITGCSPGGIGEGTVKALAKGGAGLLILAGRSQSKLDAVAATLDTSKTKVRTLILDLSSQQAVRKAAAEVEAYDENIDILINNAATIGYAERELNSDGLEMMFGTNHIGHFLFTNLILGKLKSAATKKGSKTRIVNVSSLACTTCPVRFSDYNWDGKQVPKEEAVIWDLWKVFGVEETDGYEANPAYGQSKTANVLFTVGLNQRLLEITNIESFAIHPGFVASTGGTAIFEKTPDSFKQSEMYFVKDLDQGSSTTLVAALDPALKPATGEMFLSDCKFCPLPEFATDPALAERLWGLSEELVGEKFSI